MSTVISIEGKRPEFKGGGRWAPLKNVTLAQKGLDRALHRSPNLPGFVVLHGPSGWGKSMAASFCANKSDGIYVECRSYHTKKTWTQAVLVEMGIRPERTIGGMMEQIAEQLDKSQRPLIIDECDYLVDKRMIELVRDLHDMARTAILLIGEEHFLTKLLRRSERFHNRVLVSIAAQPTSLEDARSLAKHYCYDLPVADDLLEYLREQTRGNARYTCVNLDNGREAALAEGAKKMDRAWWGKRPVYRGEQPVRRAP